MAPASSSRSRISAAPPSSPSRWTPTRTPRPCRCSTTPSPLPASFSIHPAAEPALRGRVTIAAVGRCTMAGLGLIAGCSFNASGQAGGDGGTPPAIDAGGDGGQTDPDAGGPCMTGALDFSPDEWVVVADPSLDLTNDFSVEAWVRPREIDNEYHIVSRHDDGASQG